MCFRKKNSGAKKKVPSDKTNIKIQCHIFIVPTSVTGKINPPILSFQEDNDLKFRFAAEAETYLYQPLSLDFSCEGRPYGYFADIANSCQVGHGMKGDKQQLKLCAF